MPFGRILNLLITKPRTAYVMLYDTNTALVAQRSLNKRYLKDYNVNLYVNFCPNMEEDIAIFEEKTTPNPLQLLKHQSSNSSDKENACVPKNAKRSVYTFNQETPVKKIFNLVIYKDSSCQTLLQSSHVNMKYKSKMKRNSELHKR